MSTENIRLSSAHIENVTVVIRSVGERTLALCRQLIARQVSEENIVVISEVPFTQAIRRTFELGLQRNLPWTLAVDADVLVHNDAIAQLVEIVEHDIETIFEAQGQILDKLFGGPRPGGPHLFRTELLTQALSLIPDDGEVIRPESIVIKRMAALGFPWIQEEVVVGLHDYQQYYRDIYRKAFVYARKNRGPLLQHLEMFWQRLATEDPDYQVALWGSRAGKIFDGMVKLNVKHLPHEINTLLRMQGWQEKDDLPENALSSLEVSRMIESHVPPIEFKAIQHSMNGIVRAPDWKTRFNVVLKKTGWIRIIPWSVGWGLKQIGQTLQSWSEG